MGAYPVSPAVAMPAHPVETGTAAIDARRGRTHHRSRSAVNRRRRDRRHRSRTWRRRHRRRGWGRWGNASRQTANQRRDCQTPNGKLHNPPLQACPTTYCSALWERRATAPPRRKPSRVPPRADGCRLRSRFFNSLLIDLGRNDAARCAFAESFLMPRRPRPQTRAWLVVPLKKWYAFTTIARAYPEFAARTLVGTKSLLPDAHGESVWILRFLVGRSRICGIGSPISRHSALSSSWRSPSCWWRGL